MDLGSLRGSEVQGGGVSGRFHGRLCKPLFSNGGHYPRYSLADERSAVGEDEDGERGLGDYSVCGDFAARVLQSSNFKSNSRLG